MRPELFHPMFVHFPIVGIITLWIFKGLGIFQFVIKNKSSWPETDQKISKWILYPTTTFYVISIYLGDIALDAIKSTFAYLYKINQHEEFAQYGLYVLLAVTFLEVINHLDNSIFKKWKKIMFLSQWLLLCLGLYLLFKTAHSGASLVYDFQAGTMRGIP